jgi:hypothetical protein
MQSHVHQPPITWKRNLKKKSKKENEEKTNKRERAKEITHLILSTIV